MFPARTSDQVVLGKNTTLWLIQAYLWGSFLLFLVGPLAHLVPNLPMLIVFVCACNVAFAFGYRRGTRSIPKSTAWVPQASTYFTSILLIASSLYYIAAGILHVTRYSGGVELSEALMNSGQSYYRRREIGMDSFEGNDPLKTIENIFYFLTAFSPIVLIVLWQRIKVWLRVLCVGSISIHILSFIAIGTNKGIGDLLIISAAGFLVRNQTSRSARGRGMTARKLALGLIACGVLLSGFLYLSYNMVSRQEARGKYGKADMMSGMVGGMETTGVTTEMFNTVLGDRMGYGANTIVNWYMTQGYLGLGYCMSLPFEWTYGVGNSVAAMGILDQLFGKSMVWEHTYMNRAETEYGWPALGSWSTMYAWYASDIGWIGVIFLMFFFGMLVSKVWLRVLVRGDVVAMALFGQLMVQILYLVANNQLFHMRSALISTVVLIAWYVVSGRKHTVPRSR